ANFDRTGTLTHKYQAKSRAPVAGSILVSAQDSSNVMTRLLGPKQSVSKAANELAVGPRPDVSNFLPITSLFSLLNTLVGTVIANPGIDQERNRGAALHELICGKIGGCQFADTGQFPDVVDQL